jgi:hypothetical protein
MTPPHDSIADLRVELAAVRLVVRALLTHIACTGDRPADEILCEVSSMLVGTGPYGVPITDMDAELYQRAQALARERMGILTADVGRHVLAPAEEAEAKDRRPKPGRR